MKKQLFFACLTFCSLVALFSCNSGTKTPDATNVVVTTINFNKSDGADCDKPDTMRIDCATINLDYPPWRRKRAFEKSVAAWAEEIPDGHFGRL
ncbi:MAG: hypothetical protein IPM82_14805 [Saprospiraceae bacterium]|nr:hypothetical protein [Saprospiraceae bacterium]